MTEELRIPTRPLRIQLAVDSHEVFEAVLYFAGEEKSLSGLLSSRRFIPAAHPRSDRPFLVNSRSIVWAARKSSELATRPTLYECRVAVRVELTGRQALVGDILYNPLSEGHARLVDFVNEEKMLLELWAGEKQYLINKSYISQLVELDAEEQERV